MAQSLIVAAYYRDKDTRVERKCFSMAGIMTNDYKKEENKKKTAGWQQVSGIITLVILLWVDLKLMIAAHEPGAFSFPVLIFCYLTLTITLCLALQSRHRLVKIIAEILLFSAIYTDSVYIMLSGFPFSLPDAINIRNNTGYASGAVLSFASAFIYAFPITGLIYIGVKWLLETIKPDNRFFKLKWCLPVSSAILLYAILHPGIFDFMPSTFRLTGNLVTAFTSKPETHWQREQVAVQPKLNGVKHVVMIMDESVSGKVLAINGYHKETTPFLSANGHQYTNFGIATSFTNFSAGSNLALISGLRNQDMPDAGLNAFSRPNIFQYAKKAGYRTVLLDGQTPAGKLQNYNTVNDMKWIDSVLWVGPHGTLSTPAFATDSILGETIIQLSASTEPCFIYVNKSGAHWPYSSNYPAYSYDKALQEDPAGIDPPKDRHGNNSIQYLHSINRNVDQFMCGLINGLSGNNNTLVLYTSDHGENYNAGTYKMRHAAVYNAEEEEGLVPLIMIDRADFLPENFSPAKHRFTHENIFPTLLEAMGYQKEMFLETYGESLTGNPGIKSQWFLTGDLFGRGKNNRVYTDAGQADLPSAMAASTESFNSSEASPK